MSLNIPNSKEPKLGYLAIDSIQTFLLDDLQWFSVEHYLLGKRFEGTDLQSKINKSKNIAEARLISLPRYNIFTADGRIIKNIVYGPEKNIIPKNIIDNKDIYNALKAKFSQNITIQKKLLELCDITFVCTTMPQSMIDAGVTKNVYASILMKVRDDMNTPLVKISHTSYIIDEKKSTLSVQEITFINDINKILIWINEIEGTQKIYPEMCFDALYNIINYCNLHNLKLKSPINFKLWTNDIKNDLSIMKNLTEFISRTPKFYNMFREVEKNMPHEYYNKRDQDYIQIPSIISIIIKHIRDSGNNVLYTAASSFKKSNIKIPPEFRSYRASSIPITIHRKHKKQQSDKHISKITSKHNNITDVTQSGKVISINGDLRTFTDAKWLCVVANSTSLSLPGKTKSTLSENVTRSIYERYPYSNIYTSGNRSGVYPLGDVIVSIPHDQITGIPLPSTPSHRYIITLIAEFSSGGPKKNIDTKDARRGWFSNALTKIHNIVNDDTIAFSSNSLIEDYRDILISVSKKMGLNVYIISQEMIDIPISEDITSDQFERGIMYTKLFKPHKLSPSQHSLVVSNIENMKDIDRYEFISTFVKMDHSEQNVVLHKLCS